MNLIRQFAGQLSILRSETSDKLYVNLPLLSLEDLASRLMSAYGMEGEIQKPDQYHITLAIAENCSNGQISQLIQNLSLPIKFIVEAASVGTFPDAPSKPFMMVVNPNPALIELQQTIYNAILKMGLGFPEPNHFIPKEWTPHITLALNVDRMPDNFDPILPVKLYIDRVAFTRDDYDSKLVLYLPGQTGDRPFVTVGHKHYSWHEKSKIGVEISVDEMYRLMSYGRAPIRPTGRVVTLEDGPFKVRHGIRIGQEGRAGEVGGSQPGYEHVSNSYGWTKEGEGWKREITLSNGNKKLAMFYQQGDNFLINYATYDDQGNLVQAAAVNSADAQSLVDQFNTWLESEDMTPPEIEAEAAMPTEEVPTPSDYDEELAQEPLSPERLEREIDRVRAQTFLERVPYKPDWLTDRLAAQIQREVEETAQMGNPLVVAWQPEDQHQQSLKWRTQEMSDGSKYSAMMNIDTESDEVEILFRSVDALGNESENTVVASSSETSMQRAIKMAHDWINYGGPRGSQYYPQYKWEPLVNGTWAIDIQRQGEDQRIAIREWIDGSVEVIGYRGGESGLQGTLFEETYSGLTIPQAIQMATWDASMYISSSTSPYMNSESSIGEERPIEYPTWEPLRRLVIARPEPGESIDEVISRLDANQRADASVFIDAYDSGDATFAETANQIARYTDLTYAQAEEALQNYVSQVRDVEGEEGPRRLPTLYAEMTPDDRAAVVEIAQGYNNNEFDRDDAIEQVAERVSMDLSSEEAEAIFEGYTGGSPGALQRQGEIEELSSDLGLSRNQVVEAQIILDQFTRGDIDSYDAAMRICEITEISEYDAARLVESVQAAQQEKEAHEETGAGGGFDPDRLVDDMLSDRLEILVDSDDPEIWEEFKEQFHDWDSDAQGILRSVLDMGEFEEEITYDGENVDLEQLADELEIERRLDDDRLRNLDWEAQSASVDEDMRNIENGIEDRVHEMNNLSFDELADRLGITDVELSDKTKAQVDRLMFLQAAREAIDKDMNYVGFSSAILDLNVRDAIYTEDYYREQNNIERRRIEEAGGQLRLGLETEESDKPLRMIDLENNVLLMALRDACNDDEHLRELAFESIEEIPYLPVTIEDLRQSPDFDWSMVEGLLEGGATVGGGFNLSLGRGQHIYFARDTENNNELVAALLTTDKSTEEYERKYGDTFRRAAEGTGFEPEDISGEYIYLELLGSKRRKQGYGTGILIPILRKAYEDGKGIAGSSAQDASEFYDHLGAIWVDRDGRNDGGLAFLPPKGVQNMYGWMNAYAEQVKAQREQQAEEGQIESEQFVEEVTEGIERGLIYRAMPRYDREWLKHLIEIESVTSANLRPQKMAELERAARKNGQANMDRLFENAKWRKEKGQEEQPQEEAPVERSRRARPRKKAVYEPRDPKYPDWFAGQEKIGYAPYGNQVFQPYLQGHLDYWDGGRRSAGLQSYHRVNQAIQNKEKNIRGIAVSHNGEFVGIGSLNYEPKEVPEKGDWIEVESLISREGNHAQGTFEALIKEVAKNKRGVFMNGGKNADHFLTGLGMSKAESGAYFLTADQVAQYAKELEGPIPGKYIAPKTKPKIRQRFGRLFQEDEIESDEAPPRSRKDAHWQDRERWDRFNWEAWNDPESIWNPDTQMQMGYKEDKERLFQDESDEVSERGKHDILNKIEKGGQKSMAFGRLMKAVAEVFGGRDQNLMGYLKSAEEYEKDYGEDLVWANGKKIKPHDPAHYDRLLDFAQEAEGVRDDDVTGKWEDAAEYIYNRTQQRLKKAGFEKSDEVRLYRGIPDEIQPGWMNAKLNALSSWTFDRSTAAQIATNGRDAGTLLRADVPINRIFSMWATGPGKREKMEYMILGQDGIKAWASKISRKK